MPGATTVTEEVPTSPAGEELVSFQGAVNNTSPGTWAPVGDTGFGTMTERAQNTSDNLRSAGVADAALGASSGTALASSALTTTAGVGANLAGTAVTLRPVPTAQTTLAAGATWSQSVVADGPGAVGSAITYSRGTHITPTNSSGPVGGGSSVSQPIVVQDVGTVSGSLDWTYGSTGSAQSKTAPGAVPAVQNSDTAITVTGNGAIHASVNWTPAVATADTDLALYLLDPTGAVVASSDQVNNATNGYFESIAYTVPDAAPFTSRAYTLRVQDKSLADQAYSISESHPVTPNLDLELDNPFGTPVAHATNSATAKPESLTYTVPSGSTGTYSFKVISRDYDSAYTLTASSPTKA